MRKVHEKIDAGPHNSILNENGVPTVSILEILKASSISGYVKASIDVKTQRRHWNGERQEAEHSPLLTVARHAFCSDRKGNLSKRDQSILCSLW